ncbi:SRPBCC family protein [uncultured Phenylobacterium sp.]|uniref:SRPBCC family protein n=1 Tax=uncultured Phenylobacterium sp. TaxID=349273 RepID=UPI0025DC1877|nr:SRPBCC family protein [uncultured Phenylobacterium sp.]
MAAAEQEMGDVRRVGETVEMVFHRRYARPIEKVWAALTVPERLADWFAETTIDRFEVGGTMQLYFRGADYRSKARIVALEPPHVFAWAWSEPDGTKESLVRFDLRPDGDGCRLTLTHTKLSVAESEGVAAGWHAHLEALQDATDAIFTPWSVLLEREAKVSPLYRA